VIGQLLHQRLEYYTKNNLVYKYTKNNLVYKFHLVIQFMFWANLYYYKSIH